MDSDGLGRFSKVLGALAALIFVAGVVAGLLFRHLVG